ncbi:condensation domain-containing protein [Kitasatospora sp. NPDC004240]
MAHRTPDAVTHRIAFTGDRAATGPATWGQKQIWRDIQWMLPDTAFFNVSLVTLVPPGVSVPDVLEQLAELVTRHESLRTLAVIGEDGELGQRVLAGGEIEVEVLSLTGAEHGAELREHFTEAEGRLLARGFDNTVDVPFRALVGALDGAPQAVVLCLSHFAADLISTRLLIGELTGLLAARAAGEAPPARRPAREPLEQAAFELSPAGARLEEKALRYWRDQLDRAPADTFPRPPGESAGPRFWRGELISRAVPQALQAAAERHRTSIPTVLLAATATLLARSEGLKTCGLKLVVGNRYRPELRDAVGNLTQEVFAAVDVSGETVAEVVKSAWSAALAAYRNGQFRPERARVLAEEAGVAADCLLNDLWSMTWDATARPTASAAELAAAAEESEFRWAERGEQDEVAFFLELFDVFGEPDLVRIALLADTTRMAPERIEGFLFGLERLLLALAGGEVAPTDFPAVAGLAVPEGSSR